MLDHDQGKQNSFYYERDTAMKSAPRVNQLNAMTMSPGQSSTKWNKLQMRDTLSSAKQTGTLRRSQHSQSMSAVSNRCRSLEASQRLLGALAFQTVNRHRYP